jgi:hypothetical protein
MMFFDEPEEAFSLITLLQMGKNYEHNSDRYVYGYAPFGNGEGAANQLAMFRVAKDRILDRSAYDFFAAHNRDGSAKWSKHIEDRGVLHAFLRCYWPWTCWHPSVVYNAPFGVYMMANWGMGRSADGPSMVAPSYLGFWLAETPWGRGDRCMKRPRGRRAETYRRGPISRIFHRGGLPKTAGLSGLLFPTSNAWTASTLTTVLIVSKSRY